MGEGGEGEVHRSRGTRRRGSGRKRETSVRVSSVDQREMRIARLGWPLGRLSCWGPNRVREVGRSVSPSLIVFLFSSSASSFLPPTLQGDHRVFILSVLRALRSLSHSLLPDLSLLLVPLSLSQGENGSWPFPSADFAANPARGGSTSTPLYPYTPASLPVLPALFATLLRSGPLRSRRVAVFLRGIPFLYARDCIVRSFNAP